MHRSLTALLASSVLLLLLLPLVFSAPARNSSSPGFFGRDEPTPTPFPEYELNSTASPCPTPSIEPSPAALLPSPSPEQTIPADSIPSPSPQPCPTPASIEVPEPSPLEMPAAPQPPQDEMGRPAAPTGTTVYVYGKGLVVSKSSDGTVLYYHQDALGSNRVVTDSAGQIQSKSAAYPYGEPVQVEGFGSKQARFTFTGKEQDSKLYYYGARYYNPRTMRFTGADPVSSTGSYYAYANNNPLRFTDPTGMTTRDEIKKIILPAAADNTRVETLPPQDPVDTASRARRLELTGRFATRVGENAQGFIQFVSDGADISNGGGLEQFSNTILSDVRSLGPFFNDLSRGQTYFLGDDLRSAFPEGGFARNLQSGVKHLGKVGRNIVSGKASPEDYADGLTAGLEFAAAHKLSSRLSSSLTQTVIDEQFQSIFSNPAKMARLTRELGLPPGTAPGIVMRAVRESVHNSVETGVETQVTAAHGVRIAAEAAAEKH